MQAAYGPRFVLGLGLGAGGADTIVNGKIRSASYPALRDYVGIIRALWRGDKVDYDGPAGTFSAMRMDDRHDGPDPEIWYGTFGLPKGAELSAACMDGVLLIPNLTPEATRASVARIRAACERVGRDPATFRIAQSVVTAPELDDTETRQICHARALTYLQTPGWGDTLVTMNGWSADKLAEIRSHASFRATTRSPTVCITVPSSPSPRKRSRTSGCTTPAAIGSVAACADQLQRYRDAGADEIVTYGSTPGQNAALAREG